MKYILLMYNAEEAFSDEELPRERDNAVATCHELHEQGQYVSAAPLQPVAMARSLRVRNGECQVMDGPFAETKEQLGGYVLIDVDNLDEAIAIAEKFPSARRGTVEIRPLFPRSNAPDVSFC